MAAGLRAAEAEGSRVHYESNGAGGIFHWPHMTRKQAVKNETFGSSWSKQESLHGRIELQGLCSRIEYSEEDVYL